MRPGDPYSGRGCAQGGEREGGGRREFEGGREEGRQGGRGGERERERERDYLHRFPNFPWDSSAKAEGGVHNCR